MKRNSAFTLIELFMVIAIIGFTVAIVVPVMSRSLRGSQLRAAARTVATLGRYTRSMAVLGQENLLLAFDLDGQSVTVLTERTREARKTRVLEHVRIESVEAATVTLTPDGRVEALYRSNGTCTPYIVTLRDERGQAIRIVVDTFSSAQTEEA